MRVPQTQHEAVRGLLRVDAYERKPGAGSGGERCVAIPLALVLDVLAM
jgi:hypothetical protein